MPGNGDGGERGEWVMLFLGGGGGGGRIGKFEIQVEMIST